MDVVLFDGSGNTLYTVQKKQYDSYTFTAQTEGVYKFCFSNEFSTFSHKVVYFDFQAGDETPLTKEMGTHHTALTQMETACVTIHEDLKVCKFFRRKKIAKDTLFIMYMIVGLLNSASYDYQLFCHLFVVMCISTGRTKLQFAECFSKRFQKVIKLFAIVVMMCSRFSLSASSRLKSGYCSSHFEKPTVW